MSDKKPANSTATAPRTSRNPPKAPGSQASAAPVADTKDSAAPVDTKDTAPATDTKPPAALSMDEQLAAKRKEIEQRIAARKKREEEDAAALAMLESGVLPPEESKASGISIVTLNNLGADARAAHRALAALDSLSTDEEAKGPEFAATKAHLTSLRDRGMVDWANKHAERTGSGASMKGLLPLALSKDAAGNVIKVEHSRKKGGATSEASAAE